MSEENQPEKPKKDPTVFMLIIIFVPLALVIAMAMLNRR
jgi:hypothetical protein